MTPELPAGSIGLDERLRRLEDNDQRILLKLETLAKSGDVERLETRVEHIEARYISKPVIWTLVTFLIAQFLVIMGLGLGFLYEVLKK